MKKLLWKIFKDFILGYFNKTDKPQLMFAFYDMNGKRYDSFVKDAEISVDRLKWINTFRAWLIEGVTHGEMGDLLEIGKKETAALITDLSNKKEEDAAKHAGRINSIFSEISRRRDAVFNRDLLLQYLAVQYIREDEDPDVFSPEIHDEKVKQFEKETNLNHCFFFGKQELKQLTNLYRMSLEEFALAWQESLIQKIQNQKITEILK